MRGFGKSPANARYREEAMRKFFPHALVEGYEPLIRNVVCVQLAPVQKWVMSKGSGLLWRAVLVNPLGQAALVEIAGGDR